MGEDLSYLRLLKQGAEAKLYVCRYLGKPTLIKERFKKAYRHPDLDASISKERLKNEARSIARCQSADIRVPAIYLIDFVRRQIYMQHFEKSITVKDFIILHIEPDDTRLALIAKLIGQTVRKLHDNNIIHGDLTTSNMLLVPKKGSEYTDWVNGQDLELVMIDFGLSHLDSGTEDKGVDLYVLERALISTHNNYPNLFNDILEAYKKFSKSTNIKEIINKFEEVRARGRKRTMIG